jgi:hypothetical protein
MLMAANLERCLLDAGAAPRWALPCAAPPHRHTATPGVRASTKPEPIDVMPAASARTSRLAGSLWLPRLALAAVALAVVILTAGAITASPALVLIGAALGFAGEAAFAVSGRRLEDLLSRAHLGSSSRTLVLAGLLLAGAVRVLAPVPAAVTLLGLAAVLAPAIGQVAYAYPTNFSIRRHQAVIAWRNLPTHPAGPTGPAPLRTVLPVLDGGPALRYDTTASSTTLDFAALLLVAGIAVAVATSAYLPLMIGSILVVVVVVAVVVASMLQWRRVRRDVQPGRDNAEVVAAVEALAPEIVVYFSSPLSGTYALALWLEVFEQFRESCLVILREPEHLDRLGSTSLPIVVATSATDVEALAVDTVKVALYPTNVVKNNHLLRVPGIRHCFIGHGDSDKAGSYSPISRVYDEIWVAGAAGADRYAAVGEGVRGEQIVPVGRPTLAHVHRRTTRPDPAHPVVLYAPTWEGFYDESDYSSLASMGERIVDGLLGAGARVVFKAHPATGERNVHARAVAESIARRLDAREGSRAIAADGPPVDELFDEVDVAVTDVSSVISDFLASSKPYLVTNPKGLDARAFVAQFPAAAAAHLVAPDCVRLPALLADAVGPDVLRDRREVLATYLLGPPTADPVGRFTGEVSACIRRCDDDRAARAVGNPSTGRAERMAT